MKNMFARRALVAVIGTAILVPMSAGLASAQDVLGVEPEITNAQIDSLLNDDNPVSLTINKYKSNELGESGDGTPGEVPEVAEAYDATFTLYKLDNLDPTNIDDWKAYAALNDEGVVDLPAMTIVGEYTTTNGTVTITNKPDGEPLERGFYYVVENAPDAQAGENAHRTTINPFYIALPMTNPDNATWNYAPTVDPKNQEISVTKTVEDAFTTSGKTVNYTLVGDVPALASDKDFYERYVMVDRQPEHIAIDRDSIAVSIDGTPLAAEDFEVRDSATAANTNDTIIALTETGLQKLTEAKSVNPTAQVTVTLTGNVGSVDEAMVDMASGPALDEINTVYLYTDYGIGDNPDEPDENDPWDDVTTKLGKINVNKSGEDTQAPLAGAMFELYRCTPGTTETQDGPISVNGQSEWTTDENGVISISGIQVEDYRNDAEVTDDFDYCLVETTSPDGYELLPDPVSVSVTADNAVATANIVNVPDNGGFKLPETGAMGTGLLITVGAGLIGGGMLASKRREDKKNEDQVVTA